MVVSFAPSVLTNLRRVIVIVGETSQNKVREVYVQMSDYDLKETPAPSKQLCGDMTSKQRLF